jgi:signal peptidase II
MFYLSSALVFLLDQLSKLWMAASFHPGQSFPLIKNVLHLTYVQNRGAAFGLFQGQRVFLLVVGLMVMGLVFYFHLKVRSYDFLQIPLGLIWGGSLGNLIDRFLRRYVVDFIDLRVWPVFNLADALINLGVFLIIARLLLVKEGKDVSRSA